MRYNIILFLTIILSFLPIARSQENASLVLSQTISLPNIQGGFNHMSVDAEHQRLFAAAPTNKSLEIIDLKTGKPYEVLRARGPEPPATPRSLISSTSHAGRAFTFTMGRRST